MRRLLTIALLALTAATLVASPAGAAPAADSPTITRVTPMRVSVGNRLVILGKHFKARRKANTIIFRAPDNRTAFVKPRRASRTKLVVTIPESVARLLNVANSRQRPTRLKLRVVAARKMSKYTPRRLSPVVTGVGGSDGGGGGGGGGGSTVDVCDSDADHDNDLLPNALELDVKTDPCLADTDGDSMSDGWEFYAAQDLNIKAVPYPAERPWPNALDPQDGAAGGLSSTYDFDGDGLTTLEEYRAWVITGSSFDPARLGGLDLESPLGYSDGTKYSRNVAPGVPAWRGPAYGLLAPTGFPATYNFVPAGGWRDDERDADADGLANWLESAGGPSTNEYWKGFWSKKPREIKAWDSDEEYCGLRPGYFDEVPFVNLDLADPDVDGDTLLDGEDDQDHDGYSNITEMYELLVDLDGNGNPIWCLKGGVPTIDLGGNDVPVNAMNPCVPNIDSRTCHDYVPF